MKNTGTVMENNKMSEKYRLEINKLDNGYTVRKDNDNPPSRVFMTLEYLIEFIKDYFKENDDGSI